MEHAATESLDYVKQVTTDSLILAYLDPDRQYYLFTDSDKVSLSEILIQYMSKQKEVEQK